MGKPEGLQSPFFQSGLGLASPSFSQPPSFQIHQQLSSKHKGTCGFSFPFIFTFPPSCTTIFFVLKIYLKLKSTAAKNQINSTHKPGFKLHVYCEQSFVSLSESRSLIILDYMKDCWSKHIHWNQPKKISRTAKGLTQPGSSPGFTTHCQIGWWFALEPQFSHL